MFPIKITISQGFHTLSTGFPIFPGFSHVFPWSYHGFPMVPATSPTKMPLPPEALQAPRPRWRWRRAASDAGDGLRRRPAVLRCTEDLRSDGRIWFVYESNNYGICKIGTIWCFIEVYEDWLRFISLLLICDLLFVVYESNNYGVWEIRKIWWFHCDLLRFMRIDWDLLLLIVTYLWFVCGLWIQ